MKKLILLPLLILIIAGCQQSVKPIYWETAIQVCKIHGGVTSFMVKAGDPNILYCNDGSQYPQNKWYTFKEYN